MNVHRPKLLLVDDAEGISQFFAEFLQDQAFDVTTIEPSLEVAAKLASSRYDMVVADIAKLKEREALIRALPSSGALCIWASHFKNLEPDQIPPNSRLLNKPFRAVDLRYAVRAEFVKAGRRFDTI